MTTSLCTLWLALAGQALAAEPSERPSADAGDKIAAVIKAVEQDSIKRRIRLLAPEKAVRLAELVCRKKPTKVVEAGTAIGYSGLWIGRELKRVGRGKLITMEIDPKIAREAEANFQEAGLEEIVTLKLGDARETAKEIEGPVDFLLIDCIPTNYYRVFLALEDKLSDGAIVFADNAGYGAAGMKDYLKHVRGKYNSRTEWFDIDLPWAKRDAVEITIVSQGKKGPGPNGTVVPQVQL